MKDIILLLLLGGVGYYYYYEKQKQKQKEKVYTPEAQIVSELQPIPGKKMWNYEIEQAKQMQKKGNDVIKKSVDVGKDVVKEMLVIFKNGTK